MGKVTSFFKAIFGAISQILKIKRNLKSVFKLIFSVFSFHLLLIVYIINEIVVASVLRMRLLPRPLSAAIMRLFSKVYDLTVRVLDKNDEGTISRVDLIQLAIKNMRAKMTRSIITVSGMAIGIGAIVFLVSLGYGIEKLVTSKVARLDEMSQADISPQTGGKVVINDDTISKFKDISHVKLSLPQIAIVGRVNYNNSVSDMAVYGVTSDYLKQSAIKPTKGVIFDNNEMSVKVSNNIQQEKVANLEHPAIGEKIAKVTFVIEGKDWKRVRKSAEADAAIIGYLKPNNDPLEGEEIWGDKYSAAKPSQLSADTSLGKWITGPFTVWEKKKCVESDPLCSGGEYVRKLDPQIGYISQINTLVSYQSDPSIASILSPNGSPEENDLQIIAQAQRQQSTVLGDQTATPSGGIAKVASDSADITLESIASASATAQKITKVDLPNSATRQAVVNAAMLRILGLTEADAIGKKFNASFIIVGSLLDKQDTQVESNPAEYSIIGVVPDDKTPYFYVPFADLRSLGITTFSQIKVVAESQSELGQIRKKIEGLGYSTHSVSDTVAQISSIFGTVRLLLALLGMVALSIASLGMFNTLTVSLLERTREVGLMKAMGMKSSEVRELFLTESMIMGIFGGLFGLLTGYLMGKGVGLILSIFSISKGAGFIDISYIPGFFITIIVVLSLVVGIVTGLYPARRATKISALNALRYE